MTDIYFTEDHEWIAVDGGDATVGITAYAAGQLGDVVFVELPEAGRVLACGDEVAIVESVKAASEIYAPASGTVSAVNDALEDTPATVNEDAEGAGWFLRMTLSSPAELSALMDRAAYDAYLATLD
jgi:glycine cleavage system H protein